MHLADPSFLNEVYLCSWSGSLTVQAARFASLCKTSTFEPVALIAQLRLLGFPVMWKTHAVEDPILDAG